MAIYAPYMSDDFPSPGRAGMGAGWFAFWAVFFLAAPALNADRGQVVIAGLIITFVLMVILND